MLYFYLNIFFCIRKKHEKMPIFIIKTSILLMDTKNHQIEVKIMEDLNALREEHWKEFKEEYINPLKKYEFPKIDYKKDEFNKCKIRRVKSGEEITPTLPEEYFAKDLIWAQENKKNLLPYLWIWGLSYKTFAISDYCRKRLLKTIQANGIEEYPGYKQSVRFTQSKFDEELLKKLKNASLNGDEFCNIVKEFANDYQVVCG